MGDSRETYHVNLKVPDIMWVEGRNVVLGWQRQWRSWRCEWRACERGRRGSFPTNRMR